MLKGLLIISSRAVQKALFSLEYLFHVLEKSLRVFVRRDGAKLLLNRKYG